MSMTARVPGAPPSAAIRHRRGRGRDISSLCERYERRARVAAAVLPVREVVAHQTPHHDLVATEIAGGAVRAAAVLADAEALRTALGRPDVLAVRASSS